MWVSIYYFFSYVVFFYSIASMLLLLYLTVMSLRAQRNIRINIPDDDTVRYILKGSPMTPAVSIIAPAYNEEVTIIDNVKSMLNVRYPRYDIIIVNDGSKDRTLELLIEEFDLMEVPFTNTRRVPCKPIKRVFRSRDDRFDKLIVVDKEPGGRKADASNAGINITENKYFVCTDVDCYVEPMALYRMMWLVVNSHIPVIGVGATMLMGNNCVVKDGRMVEAKVPSNPLTMWQELEYMRSFLIGKLGWSSHNALPNISGGFGLFDTDVVVKSGGYESTSFAEDIDLLLRMITYMHSVGQEYRLAQIPKVSCWTEGPYSLRTLYRQRVRWARGLCEIVVSHKNLFFNMQYGPIGTFTLPYIFMFEFLAPIIEATGFLFMLWLVFVGGINWNTAFVIFGMIYSFSLSLTFLVLIFDYQLKVVNWKSTTRSYIKLAIAGITEAFFYHPLITLFSLIGYTKYIRNSRAIWTHITRKGWQKNDADTDKTNTTNSNEPQTTTVTS